MFSHVMLGATDLEASRRFYDATLATLRIAQGIADDKGRVFYTGKQGRFAISRPIDGEPACAANGATLGFQASSAEEVDAWHAAGVASGGTTCEDPPGLREGVAGKFYLAYLRDPAGNKVCAMHRPKQ
jgi:catechol 2,3-dioxygenase-like lactoylglutathione lyase family enzyme